MVKNNNHNKNNKMPPNPFSPQYPADPKYFADRNEHLDYFTKAIANSAKIRPPAPSNFSFQIKLVFKIEHKTMPLVSHSVSPRSIQNTFFLFQAYRARSDS